MRHQECADTDNSTDNRTKLVHTIRMTIPGKINPLPGIFMACFMHRFCAANSRYSRKGAKAQRILINIKVLPLRSLREIRNVVLYKLHSSAEGSL